MPLNESYIGQCRHWLQLLQQYGKLLISMPVTGSSLLQGHRFGKSQFAKYVGTYRKHSSSRPT